ncbi:GNAT family N-acetyltransferase [Bacteriovorax sp. Seq25_V]|uniref:GNAT family N-acetyltransferase n=1 Tax=Bacteriovorax sp. Seq25_V TaxID=1201288 RepID=UPI00038A0880|nr:GNAT family N-acetyltransferase [Bacteriovorax sp. Seq25_V]EQC45322.1 FR47-like protein [Bacteriovorax sp. Seq25_V]
MSFKLELNSPFSAKAIEDIYRDQEVLISAMPDANFPFDHDQWSSWFFDEEKSLRYSFILNEGESAVAHCAVLKYKEAPGLAYICFVAVAKNQQGRGLSRVLLNQVHNYLWQNLKISEIYLLVDSKNVKANNLYNSMGYKYIDGSSRKRLKRRIVD